MDGDAASNTLSCGGLPASKQKASTILLDHQTYQNLPTVDFIQKD